MISPFSIKPIRRRTARLSTEIGESYYVYLLKLRQELKMHNHTFMLLAGRDIAAEQYVMVDETTRRIVPAACPEDAIGHAVVGCAAGHLAEISPMVGRTQPLTDLEADSSAFTARIHRLVALELEHAGRLN